MSGVDFSSGGGLSDMLTKLEETDFIERYKGLAQEAAINSSERESVATKVERDAEKIKKAEYMENHIGEVYDGVVSSITSFGMFVELENTVEGLIRFDDMGSNDYFIYDEDRKILIGEHTKKTYSIGDKVTIRVKYASKLLRYIDFEVYNKEENEAEYLEEDESEE